MAITFDKTRDTAAEVAEYICARFAAGYRGGLTLGGCHFELTDIAMCSEFARECCEAAAGTGDHSLPHFGGDARETEARLAARGTTVANHCAERGDVVCFNRGNAGKWGHIGLYLGSGLFAENTSSKTRGPGFVISKMQDMSGRISGFYNILPARPASKPHDPPLLMDNAKTICEGRMIDGKLWTPTRKTLQAAGKDVKWDGEQGKGYIIDGK